MAENKNIASSWLQQQAQKELGNTATADAQASAPKMVSSTQTGGASAWLKQQVGKTKVDYLQENYDRIKAEWDAAYGKEGWAELDFQLTDAYVALEDAKKEQHKQNNSGDSWFQGGYHFSDGYQFGDVTKTVIGSAADLFGDIGAGLAEVPEKLLDAAVAVAPYFAAGQYYANGGGYNMQADAAFKQQHESAKDIAADFVAKDLYDGQVVGDAITNVVGGADAEVNSVFGNKTDALAQSGGQLVGTALLQAAGVPAWLTTGLTSYGSEMENALNQGASYEEASLSSLITAGAETLTEQFSSGINISKLGTLDEAATQALARGISNKILRTAAKLGMDMAGEGAEEVASGLISAVGQKLTYMDEAEWKELFSKESAWESFIGGAILGGIGGTVQTGQAEMQGKDYVSGLSKEQDALVRQDYQAQVEQASKNGKVTESQKAEFWNNSLQRLEAGLLAQDSQSTTQGGENLQQPQTHVAGKSPAVSTPVVGQAAQVQSPANAMGSLSAIGIRDQIRGSQETLSAMPSAADIQVPAEYSKMDIASKKNWVVEKLRPTGYKVERKGFGIIDFAKKRLKSAFNYFNKDSAEEAAFEALPYVLEKGVEITSRESHKDREYGTVTIAAPITLNGKRGNMAVVVKQTDGNHYKVHRILTPDGSVFILPEMTNEAESTPAGESPKNGSLATPKDPASNEDVTQVSVEGQSTNHKTYAQSELASPSSNNNIAQRVPGVNPNEAVGAAPAWFDVNTRLQYEYGTIPEGENPVRPDDLPKRDYTGGKVSETARTAKGAEATPDEFVDLLNKEVAEGGLSYIPITNSETTQKAIDYIKNEGWEAAKAKWEENVRAGKAGADLVAQGALLLNNAANAGDKATWLSILHDYQQLGTNTAQGLQALRILKKLAPEDKLYMIKRSVERMVEDMRLDTDITIDEALVNEYDSAETDEQRDAVLVKIQQNVADQIPSTFMDKFTALRYVNMLGNLRTQLRNVFGNAGMKLVRSAHNAVAAGIEDLASKLSGGNLQRTRSVTVSKEQKAAAAKDFDHLKTAILSGGKYTDTANTSTEFSHGVQDKRTIFKGRNKVTNAILSPLEGYRKATNWAMENGDIVFAKDAYARALAGYLKANGITETDYSKIDTAVLDEARLFAAKEAQEATFRDNNWLSDWVSKAGRRKTDPKFVRLISEGIMPFRKTPANVLIRAEEYSPLGLINSLVTSAQKAAGNSQLTERKGFLGDFARAGKEISGAQVINSWAKSLTGTGIFGLGMLLQNLGCLTGGPGEDEDKDAFESMNGWQNYALVFPDGTNVTIDWLTPAAMPLLMGSELMKMIHDGGISLKDIEKALTSLSDPMIQMSMLQGINDTLENVRYADNTLGQMLLNAGLSYLTQGLTNTALGQLERSFEDTRMTTYVDEETDVPTWLQRALGKASAKIPGWDYNQVPYINAWGEEEENPSWAAGLAENMLSPGYIEKGASDEVYNELVRLNEVQDKNVFPGDYRKEISYTDDKGNSHTKELTAEEYATLAKAQGQQSRELVEEIVGMDDYKGLTDAEKAKVIQRVYEYSAAVSKSAVIEGYSEEPPYITNRAKGMSVAEAIIRQTMVGTTKMYTDLPLKQAVYIAGVFDLLEKEKKADGTEYASVCTVQKVEALAGSNLSEKQQEDVMDDILDDGAYEKYVKILAAGYDTDDYAAAYRLYQDTEKSKYSSKKDTIINAFVKELGITRNAAKTLYDIYAGKDD